MQMQCPSCSFSLDFVINAQFLDRLYTLAWPGTCIDQIKHPVFMPLPIYIYSPGMNAEDDVDDKVIECCTDADVFVYVANGTATFETSVSSSADRQHKHVKNAMNTC